MFLHQHLNPLVKWMIYATTQPKEIRPGFLTSLAASYTVQELTELAGRSKLMGATVRPEFFGLTLTGGKA